MLVECQGREKIQGAKGRPTAELVMSTLAALTPKCIYRGPPALSLSFARSFMTNGPDPCWAPVCWTWATFFF